MFVFTNGCKGQYKGRTHLRAKLIADLSARSFGVIQ